MSKGKIIVRNKVRDFRKDPPFPREDKRHRDAGHYELMRVTGWQITRNTQESNEVVIIFECEDLDKAKSMMSDPALAPAQELMKKAGVLDEPTVFFLEVNETNTL
jgi:hypothetical protein